ncbi:MAG: hypothetical protein QNJ46_10265 [Leptolyngbyaceae cyanobacterium MO_188.B28]|nr:hypothetical protein [Leptolyngbyaceae cyanobacterium MO_188.B28]
MSLVSFIDQQESLVLSPDCQAGLILKGRLYNDLICPGASLSCGPGFDFISAYAIGKAELCVVETPIERRQARQKRMDSIQRLQSILLQPGEFKRACLIVNLLCHWFGMEEARQIPGDLIAPLASVSCEVLEPAWQKYEASLADQAKNRRFSDPYQIAWQRILNGGYMGRRKSLFYQKSNSTQANLPVESLLHNALESGELTVYSEEAINQAFEGKSLTHREIELLVTLKDEIASGSVKQIPSSKQTGEQVAKSPYKIFCAAS